MSKIITFFNKKGGVSKTTTSFNISKDLNYYLLSNDDSVIEEIYPKKAKVMEKLQIINNQNIVYDLGGYIDKGIIELFKQSDIIVIPTTLDINSIKRTINTIKEIESYSKEIIIVITKYQKRTLSKYKQGIKALTSLNKEIYYLRESESYINSLHLGKTISEMYYEGGLNKSRYELAFNEYQQLLERLK